jgi:drug/metabolite transporter (DMT)-like permease
MFAAMLLWLTALERAPASLLSPTRGALTLFIFLLSVVVLREKPSRRSGFGVALVAAGIAIVSFLG